MAKDAWIPMLVLLMLVPAGMASHPEPDPEPGTVWTVYNRVDVDVIDNYAIVEVTADIGNRGPDPEFPFQVRVPERAMVTGLTVERDGQVWEGRIEDRDTARAEYDDQKSQEHTAALVEKSRGTQVYAFLVNVAAFESVTATLRYETYLSADQDIYDLAVEAPVSGFGEDLGASFHARICHSDGIASAWADGGSQQTSAECRILDHSVGPRHSDAPTPWGIHYMLDPTSDAGAIEAIVAGGQGYFAHRFRAPADAEQLPLDLVLILDTSGSMGRQDKLAQLQDAAVQVVRMLDGEDRLALVEFNSGADAKWSGMAFVDDDQQDQAVSEVQRLIASGSTNIEAGLREGFDSLEPLACNAIDATLGDCKQRSQILVFLTDGVPTTGMQDESRLRQLAKDLNDDARIFSLAFGDDADWGLVAGLAHDNGGAALRVPPGAGAEVDLRRFMAALTTPVLEDVEVAYDGNVEAFFTSAPVLFQGSELLVVGTFPASQTRISGTVTGNAFDGPRSYDFDEAVGSGDAVLPRLVAYAQILHYQDLMDAEGEQEDWKAIIKGLALEWGFVTDYTSLVLATETDDPVRTYDPEAASEADCADCTMSGSSSSSGDTSSSGSAPSGGSGMSSGTGSGTSLDTGGPGGDASGDSEASEEPRTPLPVWAVAAALALALLIRRR